MSEKEAEWDRENRDLLVDLRITTVGTDATSVPTLGSTSTFTSKTLTSPTIQTSPVLAAATNLKYTVASADGTATKTWDGITQSTGIKTYMGIALASVKSVNGIT